MTTAQHSFVWWQNQGGEWGDLANWYDVTAGAMASRAPGAADIVTISAPSNGSDRITGAGASAMLSIDGTVILDGQFDIHGNLASSINIPGGASLTVTDNNNLVSGSTQTVTLVGTASAPVVGLTAPSLGFGNQVLNTPSTAQTETVANTGTANLSIATVTVRWCRTRCGPRRTG